MTRSESIRTCLIGITGYGRTHLEMLRILGNEHLFSLEAATVINRTDAADECLRLEKEDCRLYRDYRAMLKAEANNLDLCCIPTGIAWHARMTLDALNAGLHVFVEKPAASTLQEVDKMRITAAKNDRIVAVGFQDLFSEAAWHAKQKILEGALGRISKVSIRGAWPRGTAYYERNNWAGRLGGPDHWILDSPANNAMAHFVMLALFLTGDTPETCASATHLQGELYRAQNIESFDTLSIRAKLNNELELMANLTHAASEVTNPEIWIRGTRGSLVWRHRNAVTLSLNGRDTILSDLESNCHKAMAFRNLGDKIRTGNSPICNLEMAREHTRLVNAMHDFLTIFDVRQDCLERIETPTGPIIAIRGINGAIKTAANGDQLLSELGLPWTRPSSQADLLGYESFGRSPEALRYV